MAKLDQRKRSAIRDDTNGNLAPNRQFSMRLRSFGIFSSDPEVMIDIASRVLKRIVANRGHHATGSFVLGDTDRNVYVLSDGNCMTGPIINSRMPWYVGSYAMRSLGTGIPVEFPSVQDILDDLVEHFRTLRPLNLTIEVAP